MDRFLLHIKNTINLRLAARAVSLCMVAVTFLSGCGLEDFEVWRASGVTQQAGDIATDDASQITSLGLTPDLDYERPVVESHIEIDQTGYRPDDRKIAVFRGDVLSEGFNIVSVLTGNTVFEGDIKSKTFSGKNETYYYGDFTDFTTPGEYYVQTDVIGYSYPFEISEDPYSGMLEDAVRQFYLNRCGVSLTAEYAGESVRSACHTGTVTLQQDANVTLDVTGGWHINSAGDRDVKKGCNILETLLLAYEYNTEAFAADCNIPESGDDIPDLLDELRVETDWLLKMQDQSTGAVYSGIISTDKGLGLDNPCYIAPADMSTTLSFASALGYFSYIYQSVDTGYATTCLQAADRAMKYASKFVELTSENEYFRAATMLYRATGYLNYRNIIEDYCAAHPEYDMSDNPVFIGCVTYLATRQKTNGAICNVMMNNLRVYAGSLVSERRDALYLLGNDTGGVDHQALLSEIARLTVVNYITSSNEYENVMEQYLHYFLGCNPQNVCYAGQRGSVNALDDDPSKDVLRQPETDAYFILLLSGIE